MLNKIIIFGLVLFTLTSCVSSKLFNELDIKYNQLKSDYDDLSFKNDDLLKIKTSFLGTLEQMIAYGSNVVGDEEKEFLVLYIGGW